MIAKSPKADDLEGNISDARPSNDEINHIHDANEAVLKDSIRLFGKFLGACNDAPSNTCTDALTYLSNASTKLNEYKPVNGTDGSFAEAAQFLIDKASLECAKGDCEGCKNTKTDMIKHLYRHNRLPSPKSLTLVLDQKLREGFTDTGKTEISDGTQYNVLARGDEIVLYDAKFDTAITLGKVTSTRSE